MRERWTQLQAFYDALVIRERIMILCALLVALFGLVDTALLHPMDQQEQRLRDQLSESVASIQHLDERSTLLAEQIAGKIPPGFERQERALKQQIEIMNTDLEQRMSSMIAPNEVTRMLEDLLSEESDLTLITLRSTTPVTLPTANEKTRPSSDAAQAGAAAEKAQFYRHGFVIELEGPYLAALHYLEAIESLPWDLSWDAIRYTVTDYPRARISIELHTLSREENWIGV